MDFDLLVWNQIPIGKGWDDAIPEPVIWTAVDLLDRAWSNASDYVGRGGVGSDQAEKYERVGSFLRQNVGHLGIYVPTVSLENGNVEFTDGRHRFAWLRDHGLRALPVEVGAECELDYRARFETSLRVGRLS
ncbi:hypothetical protein ACI2UY_22235 [Ralstonia nicotianae]